MKVSIFQVDAFASRSFTGNPAAVVILNSELSHETMQAIAAENNLSETAFVLSAGDGYHIRWFTPTVEVDLCGHATLASAHVLFNHLGCNDNPICFSSKSGLLRARRGDDGIIYLDFPVDTLHEVNAPKELPQALGIEPTEVYRGRDDFLVIFDSEDVIASLSPKMEILSKIPSRGVIVSAPGTTVDFVSRFFAPQSGVPEDPVTGSAHTSLIPYWSNRLGKKHLRAKQLSKRSGELICKALGERVEIGGRAVTYLIGEIVL